MFGMMFYHNKRNYMYVALYSRKSIQTDSRFIDPINEKSCFYFVSWKQDWQMLESNALINWCTVRTAVFILLRTIFFYTNVLNVSPNETVKFKELRTIWNEG